VVKLKKTLKAGAFTLSLLLGASIFAQTNVYAKEKPSKGEGKSRVEKVQASDKGKNSVEKALLFGLSKNSNASKSTLPPVIKQGGILIPVNAITKSLGANLVWDAENQLVTITKDGVTIVIDLSKKTATVNGSEVALSDDSESNNGTFVALQFIAKNLGVDLDNTDIGQTPDETQVSDGAQTSDSGTTTQVDTSTTNTATQTSADNTATTDTTTTVTQN
jgi:hypothetical protein